MDISDTQMSAQQQLDQIRQAFAEEWEEHRQRQIIGIQAQVRFKRQSDLEELHSTRLFHEETLQWLIRNNEEEIRKLERRQAAELQLYEFLLRQQRAEELLRFGSIQQEQYMMAARRLLPTPEDNGVCSENNACLQETEQRSEEEEGELEADESLNQSSTSAVNLIMDRSFVDNYPVHVTYADADHQTDIEDSDVDDDEEEAEDDSLDHSFSSAATEPIARDDDEEEQEAAVVRDRISQLRRENEESTQLGHRFTRMCTVCYVDSPLERAVFSSCGHVICMACAE